MASQLSPISRSVTRVVMLYLPPYRSTVILALPMGTDATLLGFLLVHEAGRLNQRRHVSTSLVATEVEVSALEAFHAGVTHADLSLHPGTRLDGVDTPPATRTAGNSDRKRRVMGPPPVLLGFPDVVVHVDDLDDAGADPQVENAQCSDLLAVVPDAGAVRTYLVVSVRSPGGTSRSREVAALGPPRVPRVFTSEISGPT